MYNGLVKTRKRLLIAFVSIASFFILLAIRLFVVCVIDGDFLRSRGALQWYRDLPIRATRGEIKDTNGDVIVGNKQVYTVYVRPRSVKNAREVASRLSELLDVDEAKTYAKIVSAKQGEITVKKNVPALQGEALRNLKLDGVHLTADSYRDYPYSSYLAQVVGYTDIDNVGQNGLEGYYNRFLTGIDGKYLISSDNKGEQIDQTVSFLPAVAGASLTTTIDLSVQSFAEEAVRAAQEEWNAKRSSMIVMDVKTGGILAMASSPTYDLNELPRHDIALLNAYSKNGMIVDVYEPGSTFKIFTTALALEAGVVTENSTFFCPGYRIVDGQRIKCWRSKGHGTQTLAEGVKNSCNCVFMDLAERLGTQRFYEGLRRFGFSQKTGVDFFSESSGLMMNEKSVKPVDLARIGFGQAVAVTPLQMLTAVCAAVNGGSTVRPHFVSNVTTAQGESVYEFSYDGAPVLSSQTSERMRVLLEEVVANGSGKKGGVVGYRVGGKTGTAQKYENGVIARGKYVSSFVGFAPADDPEIAILMTVDEPNSYAYYGSIVAAPAVSSVFEKYFAYHAIRPTQNEALQTVEMPLIEGLPYNEAVALLRKCGLQYEVEGEGDVVLQAIPLAGETLPVGDVVLLRV